MPSGRHKDGILIEFPGVVEAVTCAVVVQRGMAARNADVREDQRIESEKEMPPLAFTVRMCSQSR
jgi:hypothetical protein